MTNTKVDKIVDEAINTSVNSATLSSGHMPGDSITTLLEHTVSTMMCSDKITGLWAPNWSIFLSIIAGKIHPPVSEDMTVLGIKEVLDSMVGCSDTTPSMALSTVTTLSAKYISNTMPAFVKQRYIETAIKACNNLGIASPLEIIYMRDSLGEKATTFDLIKLYNHRPFVNKPIIKCNVGPMMELMYAKESVEKAALRAKNITELTTQATAKYRKEIEEILRESAETLEVSIRAERDVARTTLLLQLSTYDTPNTQPIDSFIQESII